MGKVQPKYLTYSTGALCALPAICPIIGGHFRDKKWKYEYALLCSPVAVFASRNVSVRILTVKELVDVTTR